MRKAHNTHEEDKVKDNSDSDRYCLDDLDLLNLRISFSSDDTNKSPQKSRSSKFVSKKGESFQRAQDLHYSENHCQNFINKSAFPSEDYIHTPLLFNAVKSTKKSIKVRNETIDDNCNASENHSLHLLYPNRDCGDFPNPVLPRHRHHITPPRTQKIDIHTLDTPDNMAHRSSRKKSAPMKEQHSSGEACNSSFPFKVTPSGNFKVNSQQVVFESQKISVLVADPEHTKVNIHPENFINPPAAAIPPIKGNSKVNQEYPNNSVMESIMSQGPMGGSLGSLIASTAPVRREKESSDYEGKITDQILDPELNLNRLGYTAEEPIDWNEVKLPEKTNLYLELYQRITNYTNADCKVYIDNEEFNCHLIVLQCYSEVFDEYVAVKKVELPSDRVSTGAFAFIYEWMITGEPAYTDLSREIVLDIFNASKYLRIKDLTEQCWAFIDNTDVFSEDTAFLLYMDARAKDLEDVRELMLPRIQKFFLMLVSSRDWLELDKEDVMNFMKSNYICVNCEMEVFMSAVRWLEDKWEERQRDILDIMSCVRFGNIAPWQLVDIKRNPENPEFLKLTSMPAICKMVDDGLAFVIIKYWYGQENDDFQHWNNILGLQEPPARNWSGMDKTYFTFREFLIYLDQYRRAQMMERSKPKEKKRNTSVESKTSPVNSFERVPPKIPTMDEFLSSRKSKELEKTVNKDEAATAIQAAFRGHLVRQMLTEYMPEVKITSPKAKHLIKQEIGSIPWAANQQNMKVLAMFNTPKPNAINEMSISALAPRHKDYLCETSLFNAERESVLVFGGVDPHNNYGVSRNTGKDIFRYLPDSNVWEYVGDLPEPRHHHSVAFLRGRVYLCGGADPRDDDIRGKSVVVDTVWSFEPVKRCWFSEGSLSTPRKNFGLVASNYSLYAIGGQDRQGVTLSSMERFVPETGNWEYQAPLITARMGIACTKFRDFIWAAGGMSGSRRSPLCDNVECYDIKTNQWTEINRLRFPRCFGRIFSMSDRLYLIGGAGKISEKEKTTSSVSDIDIWDGSSMEWKHQTDMAIPRHGHAIAYLGTQILIIGGVTTVYMRALSNTECYCTERGTWVRGIACLPTTLSGHAAITLPPANLM